jgi:hypothetical protein
MKDNVQTFWISSESRVGDVYYELSCEFNFGLYWPSVILGLDRLELNLGNFCQKINGGLYVL